MGPARARDKGQPKGSRTSANYLDIKGHEGVCEVTPTERISSNLELKEEPGSQDRRGYPMSAP
jgi:hypothetical protein